MEIEMEPDDGQQREQDEKQMWEEHKKHLELLGELLSEERKISERFNHIFDQALKPNRHST